MNSLNKLMLLKKKSTKSERIWKKLKNKERISSNKLRSLIMKSIKLRMISKSFTTERMRLERNISRQSMNSRFKEMK
jgi:hypothetical protein